MAYALAFLAACANSVASVLERKANRDQPRRDNLSWRLIRKLLGEPAWFAAIGAVIAGFLLQAFALSAGQLAAVQPILIAELPLTLALSAVSFRARLGWLEWTSSVVMAAGLAGLLVCLSPGADQKSKLGVGVWAAGLGANITLIAVLVAIAARWNGSRRAAPLGVASGAAFGLTAALMKGTTEALHHGFSSLFASWEPYAMVLAGVVAMYLLQSAMNAGRLLVVQPGTTLTDPVVAILWGTLAFGEQTRHGVFLVPAAMSAGVVGAAVIALSRSPLLEDERDAAEEGSREPSRVPSGDTDERAGYG